MVCMTDTTNAETVNVEQLKEQIAEQAGDWRNLLTTVLLFGGVLAFGFMLGVHYMASNLRPFVLAGTPGGPTVEKITAFGTEYSTVAGALPDLYHYGMQVGGVLALLGLALGVYLSYRWDND